MRRKFVPAHYQREILSKLRRLIQGTKSVRDYYQELETLMIRAGLDEGDDMVMSRFLGGLNREIQDKVELQNYEDIQEMVHKAELIESQIKRKGMRSAFSTSSAKPKEFNKPAFTKEAKPAAAAVEKTAKDEFKPKSSTSTSQVRCFKCQGMGHYSRDCPNRKMFLLQDGGEIVPADSSESEQEPEEEEEEAAPVVGEMLVTRRALSVQNQAEEQCQRENLFHTRCFIKEKVCSLIVDGGSCTNAASEEMVEKLQLKTIPHPRPYKLHWLHESGALTVSHQVLVSFSIGKYEDNVLCDVIPMGSSHILLGRPWQSDRKTSYDGYANKYSFEHKGRRITLLPLTPAEIYQDQMQVKLREKATVANSLYLNHCDVSKLFESEMPASMIVYRNPLFVHNEFSVSTNPSQELPSVRSEILQENRYTNHSKYNELYDPEMTAPRFDYDEPLAGIKQAEEITYEMRQAAEEYKADSPTEVPPASLKEANKEDIGFKGVEAQEKSATAIQEKLTSIPTLLLPEFCNTFGNECDASKVGMDAILMQDKRPIAYLSEILGVAAPVCTTYDKKLNASDPFFKEWQHYLWFQEFAIHTSLSYRKGMGNVVADALSKRYPLVSTLSSRLLGFEEIVELYETDDDFAESYGKCHKFVFENYHRQEANQFHKDRMCLPRGSTRELLARKAHRGGPAGHAKLIECLLHFESAYRHAKLSTTLFSPFEFDYGFDHQFPLDLISLLLSVKYSFAGQERGEQVGRMHAKAKENMWLYLRQDRTPGEKKDKLLLRADDLVDANKKINSHDYQIDPPGRYEKSPMFNVSNLLPCYADSDLRTNPFEEGEDDASMASQEIEAEAAPEIEVAELAEEAQVLNGEEVFKLPRSQVFIISTILKTLPGNDN